AVVRQHEDDDRSDVTDAVAEVAFGADQHDDFAAFIGLAHRVLGNQLIIRRSIVAIILVAGGSRADARIAAHLLLLPGTRRGAPGGGGGARGSAAAGHV